MRAVDTTHGYSVIVSNEEYRLLKKVDANIKLKYDSIKEYYQELGDNLVSRGVLKRIEEDGILYFVSIKRSKK